MLFTAHLISIEIEGMDKNLRSRHFSGSLSWDPQLWGLYSTLFYLSKLSLFSISSRNSSFGFVRQERWSQFSVEILCSLLDVY
jgi:hypothetical protein